MNSELIYAREGRSAQRGVSIFEAKIWRSGGRVEMPGAPFEKLGTPGICLAWVGLNLTSDFVLGGSVAKLSLREAHG